MQGLFLSHPDAAPKILLDRYASILIALHAGADPYLAPPNGAGAPSPKERVLASQDGLDKTILMSLFYHGPGDPAQNFKESLTPEESQRLEEFSSNPANGPFYEAIGFGRFQKRVRAKSARNLSQKPITGAAAAPKQEQEQPAPTQPSPISRGS